MMATQGWDFLMEDLEKLKQQVQNIRIFSAIVNRNDQVIIWFSVFAAHKTGVDASLLWPLLAYWWYLHNALRKIVSAARLVGSC